VSGLLQSVRQGSGRSRLRCSSTLLAGLRPGVVLPAGFPGRGVLLRRAARLELGAKRIELRVGICHDPPQELFVIPGEVCDRARPEEIAVVLPCSRQPFGVVLEEDAQIELGGIVPEIQGYEARLAAADRREKGIDDEDRTHERRRARDARRTDVLDELRKRKILVAIGAQGRLAHARQDLSKRGIAREIGPVEKQVDEKPDQRLGLDPADIAVTLEMDTGKDAWSIAAGTYSCRFSPGTAVAAHVAATRLRDKLAGIAAKQLNILADDIEFADGTIRSRSNPDNALPFGRVAGTAHWSPVMLPDGMAPGLSETGVWSPPELEPPTADDRINTSLTYGFVFDMCGVEIDPATFAVRIDRYVSMHDAGRLLNPMIADGQVHGAFVQGVAAALYEEFVYDGQGQLITQSFMDYLLPSSHEVPQIEIVHHCTPSPFTVFGQKGSGESGYLGAPAAVASAINDAVRPLGISFSRLPIRVGEIGDAVAAARVAKGRAD